MINKVIIVAQAKGIGITSQLIGYDMTTYKKVKRNVYNGRLCYGPHHVGIKTLKQNRCSLTIGGCPF